MVDFDLKRRLAVRASDLKLLKKLSPTFWTIDAPERVASQGVPTELWSNDRIARAWFMGRRYNREKGAPRPERHVVDERLRRLKRFPAYIHGGVVTLKKGFLYAAQAAGRQFARDNSDRDTADLDGCARDLAASLLHFIDDEDYPALSARDRDTLIECVTDHVAEGIHAVKRKKGEAA